jgi:hypothetical protein
VSTLNIPSGFQLTSRRTILLIVGFLLLFTWLTIRDTHNLSLWFDEVWSTRYAGGAQYGPISLPETVGRVVEQLQHERNPPGYYLLLNVWGRAVGWTEFAGRVLSLLSGLLAIAWTYRLAFDITINLSRSARLRFALSAAVVLGASAFIIEYAREIRAYIFIVLFAAMITALYWRLATSKQPRKRLKLAYILSVTSMLYTHYMTVLVMVVIGLYHLLLMRKDRRWWHVGILTAISGLLFLPWLSVSFTAAGTALDNFRVAHLSAVEIIRTTAYTFSNGSAALLAVLVALALGTRGRHAGAIWFWALGGTAIALFFNAVFPVIINIRYVIFLWPFIALLVALGIDYMAQRGINPVWIMLVWIVAGALISFDIESSQIPYNVRMPWKPFKAQLQEHAQPADVVMFHSPLSVWLQGPEFTHYMDGLPNRHSLLEDIPGGPENDDYYTNARNFIKDAPRVWLGVDKTLQPNFRLAIFQRALSDQYAFCYNAFNEREMRMDLYSRFLTDPLVKFEAANDAQIGIELREPLPVTVTAELSVLIALSKSATVPPDTYSVGLHITNSAGQLVAQADFGLPNADQSCMHQIVSTQNLPAGTYNLYAIAYDWRSGQRLVGSSQDSASGDAVILGTFTRSGG